MLLVEIDGRAFVAKSTRRSEAQVAWLGPVLAAAAAAGFRVPHLVRSDRGGLVADGWTLETFVAGVAGRDAAAAEPALRRFHAAARQLPQRPGFVSATDLGQGRGGGDADLAALPGDVRGLCLRALAGVTGPKAVIHGDANRGNFLLADGLPPALVDWDEARRDAVAFDMPRRRSERAAALAWEIVVCWRVEPHRARRLVPELRRALGMRPDPRGRSQASRIVAASRSKTWAFAAMTPPDDSRSAPSAIGPNRPPASFTRIRPAAMSQGFRPISQKPS